MKINTILSVCVRILFSIGIANGLLFTPTDRMSSTPAQTILMIDTYMDANNLAHKLCTDAPNDCSLRGAISISNADLTQPYTIQIPNGSYLITLSGATEDENATGDFDISGQATLSGLGNSVFIQGDQLDRVLHIHPGAQVLLTNLHVSGGNTVASVDSIDTEPGGGIYNQGSLTIQNCTIADNQTGNGIDTISADIAGGDGGSGGGIQNEGLLNIEDSILTNNQTGTGGAGYVCPTPWTVMCSSCSSSGNGGSGGAINNTGVLTIHNSSFENNTTGDAGIPGACYIWGVAWPLSGLPGIGGAIANEAQLSLVQSSLTGNQAVAYGGGLSNMGFARLSEITIAGNLASLGGGINNLDVIELMQSEVISNTADAGGGIHNTGELLFLTGNLNRNNAGLGGGIYNTGQAILASIFVQDNWTRDGKDGADESGDCAKEPCFPANGVSPSAGGIYNTGNLQLDNSSVSGNATGDGGDGGDGYWWPAADGGNGGYGGGIYNTGSMTINYTSVFSNTTGIGGLGGTSIEGDGAPGEGGYGGGIYNSGVLTATMVQVTDNHTGTGLESNGAGGGIANEGILTYIYGAILHNQTGPDGDGGGIYSSSPFTLTLTSSTVMSNTAGGRGGGIFASAGSLYGSNNVIVRNSASAGNPGSGLYLNATTANLLHTSLSQNTGGDGSAVVVNDSSLWMTNTILVSHTLGISASLGAEAVLENTLWGSGGWANQTDWAGDGSILTGTNNLWLEPGFIDPLNLDYHLAPDSAALDRGALTAVTADIDNQPRPNPLTGIADLGADEYWELTPEAAVTISGPLTATIYTPVTFTATVTPEAATPNILYYWLPPPASGQWTNTAAYQWTRTGIKEISVSAIQVENLVIGQFQVELGLGRIYLPLITR